MSTSLVAAFQPFQNDAQIVNITHLSIENGTDTILVVGDLEIHKDDPISKEELDTLIALLTKIRDA